eukprot:gnl/Trimastix_PCT/3431.p1 GENE.gnl/Trimastix_PCT/3431~~gnl/Trimastix_PCT/3431.p1  ORF type:complete len:978 (+),score=152.75 gnl/Trimastix_PCT/3431:42-2975(+)
MKKHFSKREFLNFVFFVATVVVFFGLLIALVLGTEMSFPAPNQDSSIGCTKFSEARARYHIANISQVGPHVVNTPEILLVQNYLLQELQRYAAHFNSSAYTNVLEIEVQQPSGHLFEFKRVLTYNRVINVLARVSNRTSKHEHSILIGAHFDSVGWSPGASDDTLPIATMLDLIRVFLTRKEPLQHDVIFCFNGAEEVGLLAAHGFVTQHPWAKTVRAEVNLEAMGGGGKELLFRTGPNNEWLTKLYAQHVVHPYAHGAAQDIYAAGLISSGTDWTVYTKYGGFPGLDIVYTWRGHVYHTIYDDLPMIQPGCVQHQGDNIVAVVGGIVDSGLLDPQVRHAKKISNTTQSVFYDILEGPVYEYTMEAQTVITIVSILVVLSVWIICAAVGVCLRRKFRSKSPIITKESVKCTTVLAHSLKWILIVLSPILSLAAGLLLTVGFATLISFIAPNPGYKEEGLVYALYSSTTVIGILLVQWATYGLLMRFYVTKEYAALRLACQDCRPRLRSTLGADTVLVLPESSARDVAIQGATPTRSPEDDLLFLRRQHIWKYLYGSCCSWTGLLMILCTIGKLRVTSLFLWMFGFASLAPIVGYFVQWVTSLILVYCVQRRGRPQPISDAEITATTRTSRAWMPIGACACRQRCPFYLNALTSLFLGWLLPAALSGDLGWRLVSVMVPRLGKDPNNALMGEIISGALVGLITFLVFLMVIPLVHLLASHGKTILILVGVALVALVIACCVFPYAAWYPGVVQSFHVDKPQVNQSYIAITPDSPRSQAVFKSLPHIDSATACKAPASFWKWTDRGRCHKASALNVQPIPNNVTGTYRVTYSNLTVANNTAEISVEVQGGKATYWAFVSPEIDKKNTTQAYCKMTGFCVIGESLSSTCTEWTKPGEGHKFMLTHSGESIPSYYFKLRFQIASPALPLPTFELWTSYVTYRSAAFKQHLSHIPAWASGYSGSAIVGPAVLYTEWPMPALP